MKYEIGQTLKVEKIIYPKNFPVAGSVGKVVAKMLDGFGVPCYRLDFKGGIKTAATPDLRNTIGFDLCNDGWYTEKELEIA